MKLVIDDACYAYDTIFGDFGEIFSLPGRSIDKAAVKRGRRTDCTLTHQS